MALPAADGAGRTLADIADELAVFEQATAAERFLATNHDSLRRTYPNQWIAIRGGTIVAAAASPKLLREVLRGLGFDDNQNLVEFVVDPETRILA